MIDEGINRLREQLRRDNRTPREDALSGYGEDLKKRKVVVLEATVLGECDVPASVLNERDMSVCVLSKPRKADAHHAWHRQHGVSRLGTLFGVVMLVHQVGSFAGIWLGGWAAEATGDDRLLWTIDIVLALAAVSLVWRRAPATTGVVPPHARATARA